VVNTAQAEWEDLPFDFEPEHSDKQSAGANVGGRCSRSQPCVEGALCSREGHCVCPEGTKSNPTKTGCESVMPHDHASQDGHDHGHNGHGQYPAADRNGAAPTLAPTLLPAALLSVVVLAGAL